MLIDKLKLLSDVIEFARISRSSHDFQSYLSHLLHVINLASVKRKQRYTGTVTYGNNEKGSFKIKGQKLLRMPRLRLNKVLFFSLYDST